MSTQWRTKKYRNVHSSFVFYLVAYWRSTYCLIIWCQFIWTFLVYDAIDFSSLSLFLFLVKVFPDDSGCYMVVASNAAGEARSIADLVVEEEKSPDEEKLITYQEFSSVQQKKEVRNTFIFKYFVSVFLLKCNLCGLYVYIINILY